MIGIQPHPDYYYVGEPGGMTHDYLNKRLPAATYLYDCWFIRPFEGVVQHVQVRAERPYAARCEAQRLFPDLPYRVHTKQVPDSREEGLPLEVF